MPRASNPVDAVMTYVKTAPIESVEQALHIARGIVKDRKAAAELPPHKPSETTGKAKKKKGPKPPKPRPVADGELVSPAGS